MNNLLKKLVEIDKEAQAIDNELKKEKDNLESEIQKEVQATREKYMTQAQQTVEDKTILIREDAEIQWKRNCEKYDVSRSNLEKQFNENIDKWVDNIVANVINQ